MAEAHVRPATAVDAGELGRIQSATWQQAYANLLPAAALDAMTADASAEAWRAAVTAPPSPGHVVLVAIEVSSTASSTVGFVALAPAADEEEDIDAPTAEVVSLLVEPRWGRRGHGSRLLHAAVEKARDLGADQLVCWVLAGDIASENLLRSAGWERDGWTRTLEADDRAIVQHRMIADIRDAAEDEQHEEQQHG